MAEERIRVLCVDDEPYVLEGLSLNLRRRCDVKGVTSGDAALVLLAQGYAPAVIISDMRMPGMDGATFLGKARQVSPDSVRVLLTGQSDLASTIAAVNEGQIFRFLTKPCQPAALLRAVEDAGAQHRLITAERVLLEETLRGSIKTLTDVLALADPTAFGRASRLQQYVSELAEKLRLHGGWQIDVAAMLSQLGCVALPRETAEKLYAGKPMTPDEERMVRRVPEVTAQLLGHLPRLEVVRGILARYDEPFVPLEASVLPGSTDWVVRRGAHLLRVAVDFDALEEQGKTKAAALELLRKRTDQYDAAVMDALEAVCETRAGREVLRELPMSALDVGMVLLENLRTDGGVLLAVRGYEVTSGFVERARNSQAHLPKTVRVSVKQATEVAQAG